MIVYNEETCELTEFIDEDCTRIFIVPTPVLMYGDVACVSTYLKLKGKGKEKDTIVKENPICRIDKRIIDEVIKKDKKFKQLEEYERDLERRVSMTKEEELSQAMELVERLKKEIQEEEQNLVGKCIRFKPSSGSYYGGVVCMYVERFENNAYYGKVFAVNSSHMFSCKTGWYSIKYMLDVTEITKEEFIAFGIDNLKKILEEDLK